MLSISSINFGINVVDAYKTFDILFVRVAEGFYGRPKRERLHGTLSCSITTACVPELIVNSATN